MASRSNGVLSPRNVLYPEIRQNRSVQRGDIVGSSPNPLNQQCPEGYVNYLQHEPHARRRSKGSWEGTRKGGRNDSQRLLPGGGSCGMNVVVQC